MVKRMEEAEQARTGTSCWATSKMFDIIPSARPRFREECIIILKAGFLEQGEEETAGGP